MKREIGNSNQIKVKKKQDGIFTKKIIINPKPNHKHYMFTIAVVYRKI